MKTNQKVALYFFVVLITASVWFFAYELYLAGGIVMTLAMLGWTYYMLNIL